MRLKYIIPLALIAIMVLAVTPVGAREVGCYELDSKINYGASVVWNPAPSSESRDTTIGDKLYWNNQWIHSDSNHQSSYQVYCKDTCANWGYDELSKDYNNRNQALSAYISYGQSFGGTAISSDITSLSTTFTSKPKYDDGTSRGNIQHDITLY